MRLSRTRYSQKFRDRSVKFFKESRLTLVKHQNDCRYLKGHLRTGFMLANEE